MNFTEEEDKSMRKLCIYMHVHSRLQYKTACSLVCWTTSDLLFDWIKWGFVGRCSTCKNKDNHTLINLKWGISNVQWCKQRDHLKNSRTNLQDMSIQCRSVAMECAYKDIKAHIYDNLRQVSQTSQTSQLKIQLECILNEPAKTIARKIPTIRCASM